MTRSASPISALPIPAWDEAERLAALESYAILDTPPEQVFDDIVRLAAEACDTPMALVSFLDTDRQWFKAAHGTTLTGTARDIAFCDHTVRLNAPLEVVDAAVDPRFAANPLVTAADGIRFYSAVPLQTTTGLPVGTVCVVDHVARPTGLNPRQRATLEALGRFVMTQLELRRTMADLGHSREQLASLFRQASVGIAQTDLAGQYVLVNDRYCEIVGRTREELRHLTRRDLTHPDDLPENLRLFDRLMAMGAPFKIDKRYVRPDGTPVWVTSDAAALRDAAGGVIGILAVVQDITDRVQAEQRVRAAEERLRLALEGAAIGTWDYDPTTGVLRWDDRCRALFGLPPGVPVSYDGTFLAGLHPDDRDAADAAVQRALAGIDGGHFDIEYRTVGLVDLIERWIAAKGQLDHLADGSTRFIGTVRDITLRRRSQIALQASEAALRESEAKFRAIAETMPQMVWSTRPDGFHDYYNRRWYEFTGMAEGTTDGDGWNELFHPDDRARAWERWRRALATGELYEIEYRLRHHGGTYRWVLGRAAAVLDEQGRIARWFGTCTDIDDQVRARHLLERGQDELARQMEALSRDRNRVWRLSRDLLAVSDMAGRLTDTNPAWQDVLGLGPTLLAASNILHFVHPEDRAGMMAQNAQLRTGERAVDYQCRIRHADGSYRWIAWALTVEEGLIYASGRDITAVRAEEERQRQAQKVETIGQLTGGVAHDFNNLLTVIVGNLAAVRRHAESDPARVRHAAEQALRGADRAAALTQRLLAFARRQPLQPGRVNVNELVAGMIELLTRTLGSQIEVGTHLGADIWPVNADANQVENAVLNLAVNARDAMPEGGRLQLATGNQAVTADEALALDVAAGDYVTLAVSDTGTGMPAEVQARAFEPFFTTKELGQGTGLGLSQVYGFAKQSGGTARIQSAPGRGTTVVIMLPRLPGSTGGDRAWGDGHEAS